MYNENHKSVIQIVDHDALLFVGIGDIFIPPFCLSEDSDLFQGAFLLNVNCYKSPSIYIMPRTHFPLNPSRIRATRGDFR